MRTLVPLLMALGLLLIFTGATEPAVAVGERRSRIRMPSLSLVLMLSLVAVFLLTAVLVAGLTGSGPVALATGLAATSIPVARRGSRRARVTQAVRDAWPDAIANLISSVRAGVSLPQACSDLAARAPRELKDGFHAFATTYRASGSFGSAIAKMRVTFSDPVADRVCISLLIAHEVGGGDLVRVLTTLAAQVRDDQRTRREVRARWSWTVNAARVAATAPWIVLVLMSMRPEAARAYSSNAGVTVIATGGLITIAGYLLMRRAARLPEEETLR